MAGVFFDVSCARQGPVEVITASGELDMYTAPRVQEAIDECLNRKAEAVVLNFAEVEFMDSTCMAIVLNLHRALEQRGHRLAVASQQRNVRRIFELTGVGQMLPVLDTVEDALSSVV